MSGGVASRSRELRSKGRRIRSLSRTTMTIVEKTCRHSPSLLSSTATLATTNRTAPPPQNQTLCTRTTYAPPLASVHSPLMSPRSLLQLQGRPSEDGIRGHPRKPRNLSAMDAGISDRGTTGSTPGKLVNAATRMMSRSYLSARPVYRGSPITIRGTRLSQASADGEKPPLRGFVPDNRSRMNLCPGIMQNQPLINLRP